MVARVRTREWSTIDYYAELGLGPGARGVQIDDAFRRRAKQLHPDRNPDTAAEEAFKRLGVAYEVLRDPVTRAAYDDFRRRVAAGALYDAAAPATSSGAGVPSGPAPRRDPRSNRRPMPRWARLTIGWALVAAGAVAALWALLGDLPSNSAGDTPVAVQITLAIITLKLVLGGVIVLEYPQLRARWHRPPPARTHT